MSSRVEAPTNAKTAASAVLMPAPPASQALVFRADPADVGFPWAGAALLLVLGLLAFAARWFAHQRQRGAAPGLLGRFVRPSSSGGGADGSLCVTDSVRLDAQTVLHAVRWQGRSMLVATSGTAAPVVLDRGSPTTGEPEGQP